jgi:hypothetical protein
MARIDDYRAKRQGRAGANAERCEQHEKSKNALHGIREEGNGAASPGRIASAICIDDFDGLLRSAWRSSPIRLLMRVLTTSVLLVSLVAFTPLARAQDKSPGVELTEFVVEIASDPTVFGVVIHFSSTLDTKSAADPDNWIIEVNDDRRKAQREQLKIKSVSIGTDDRSVSLGIEGHIPKGKIVVRYDIKSAEGNVLKGEVCTPVRHQAH